MRKHFLLLFLMTLLPLAGFAAGTEVDVVLYNASKTYGQLDAEHPAVNWLKFTPAAAGATEKANWAGELNFLRAGGAANQGEDVGTYRYIVESVAAPASGNTYLVAGDAAYTIKPKTIDGTFTFTLTHDQFKNTDGVTLTPADFKVTVVLPIFGADPVELTEGVDFTIATQGANTGVGADAGTITIKGKGNYDGTKQFTFEIKGTDISGMTAAYTGAALEYKGSAYLTTDFAVTDFTIGDLDPTADFMIKDASIENGTNAGNMTIKLQGKGGYSGEKTVTIPIAQKEIAASAITYTPGTAPEYTGSPIKPVGTFSIGGGFPNFAETDYEFENLKSAVSEYNKCDLKLKSDGNYKFVSGTTKKEITYTIAKRTFNGGSIIAEFAKKNNVEIVDYEYDNQAIKPAVTVTFEPVAGTKITLVENQDYTLTYAGKAVATNLTSVENDKTVTITGKGNFTEVALSATPKKYNVVKRKLKIKAEDLTVGMGADVLPTFTYDSWANGESLATLGTQAVKYVSTVSPYTEYTTPAAIKAAPQGTYEIIPLTTGFTEATALANYDVDITTPYATLTKTSSQVVVQIVDKTITWGNAFPTTGWTVEYVSGLSEKEAEVRTEAGTTEDPAYTSTMEKIIAALDQTKFKTDATELNATTEGYDVYYNGTISIVPNDYVITVKKGKLKVDKYVIVAANIAIDDADLKYTGAQVNPEVTLTVGGNVISPKFYTVQFDNNYNAGSHKAKITADTDNFTTKHKVGTKDYAYVEQSYTIAQVPLTIKVDDITEENAWVYGKPEPTYTASLTEATQANVVAGEETLVANFLAGQKPTGFLGTLKIKRTSANTVGTHVDALEASIVDKNDAPIADETKRATNYKITLEKGNLEIKKGKIVVKVKDVTLAYGVNVDANTFHLEPLDGMDPDEALNFDAIVTYEHAAAKFGYKDDYKAINTTGYTLTYEGADPYATNYDIVFANGADEGPATGTLKVTKRPVTFIAVDQAIGYGTAFEPAVNATYVKQITVADKTDATYGQYYDPATCYDLLSGDMTDLIASVAAESMNVGDNAIVLTPKASDIYEIICLPGVLQIADTNIPLVLRRIGSTDFDDPLKNTAASEIEVNDGKFVNASFTFPGQTMYANKWYTMVLPFATTVREISKAFGYAVVDVFNTNGNNPDDVAFSLHIGTVNANEPFLIKVDQDITAADFEAASGPELKNVKVENPTSAIELSDAYGNKIVGTYTGINGGFDEDYDWGLGLGKSATDWQPFNNQFVRPLGAYIHYKDRQSHNARTISIEEPDGSTTVINSVTGDQINFSKDAIYNMNGVKMQSIPTEKGVYIQNGKKIVIK
ncbi:MAG: hypothetical protein IJ804_06365 [Prevotella sp.]|nr:hypothetical protein [Prevotella sp.]